VKSSLAIVLLVLPLAACAIKEQVIPVALDSGAARDICVINNPDVRQEFLDGYKRALEGRNFTVKILPERSSVQACPLTSTYTAEWRWDLSLYLAYADLKIYRNGQVQGEALYDSTQGGMNSGKFIHADAKIQELTNKLFAN